MKIGIILGMMALCFPAWAGEPLDLASHQATYRLSLKSTTGGATSVVHAVGTMQYVVQKVCQEWHTNTTFSLELGSELTGFQRTHWKQSTTESFDGCRFDFVVHTFEQNQDKKELEGFARCENNKKNVSLSYPLASKAILPQNVTFPMQQTALLLKTAQEGKKSLSSYVYDGSKLEALNKVHAMITQKPFVLSKDLVGDVDLLNTPSYWFDIAFYNDMGLVDSQEGMPFYEASLRYFKNGISDNIVQDFGFYTLESSLIEIKKLADIECLKNN